MSGAVGSSNTFGGQKKSLQNTNSTSKIETVTLGNAMTIPISKGGGFFPNKRQKNQKEHRDRQKERLTGLSDGSPTFIGTTSGMNPQSPLNNNFGSSLSSSNSNNMITKKSVSMRMGAVTTGGPIQQHTKLSNQLNLPSLEEEPM